MSHTITLTPMGGFPGNSGMSTVKSMAFFLLFAGIVLVTIGYVRSEATSVPPRVEFRYVPRTFKQEQDVPVPVLSVFGKMFSGRGPWAKKTGFESVYPWENGRINSRPVHSYTPLDGYGRGVGVRQFA